MLNFVKQVFFLLSAEGSLVDIRAYVALHLGGTPSQETGTSPLAVYSSTTIYIWAWIRREVKINITGCILHKKLVIGIKSYFSAFSVMLAIISFAKILLFFQLFNSKYYFLWYPNKICFIGINKEKSKYTIILRQLVCAITFICVQKSGVFLGVGGHSGANCFFYASSLHWIIFCSFLYNGAYQS